jgi:hypothetical protein
MATESLASVPDIVTATVAVLALIGAIWQVVVSRSAQREATAAGLYGSYLALAVEYPKLAGAKVSIPQNHANFDEEFERYEWFVSVMLNAFEQIIEGTSGDDVWETTILDQMRFHSRYLTHASFTRGHYSDAMRVLFARLDGIK